MFLSRDQDIKGVILLALLVFIECVQMVIILGLISSFVPIPADPFNVQLFQRYKDSLKPERESGIYHIFIVVAIALQATMSHVYRFRLGDQTFHDKVKQLICWDGAWVALQLFAVFKMLIYPDAMWARYLLYLTLGLSLLSRLCWRTIRAWVPVLSLPTINIGVNAKAMGWWLLWSLVGSVQVIGVLTSVCGPVFEGRPFILFGAFIASAGLMAAFSLRMFEDHKFSRAFILVETVIAFLLLSALFKIMAYGPRNVLATHAFHILIGIAVLNKVFWSKVHEAGRNIFSFLTDKGNAAVLKVVADLGFVSLLVAMVYIPDLEAVVAKMYVGEQFHHINHFIMAPGWAYVSGAVLNVDVTSRYGVGVPVVLTTLTKLIGGFSYLNIMKVIVSLSMLYYVSVYVFLRSWLGSVPLAIAAVFMGIKLQMFYSLAFPQPFTYPSATPIRFIFDIVFIFCVWAHVRSKQRRYLYLSALSCSAAIFYMTETGLYLTAAFYTYVFMQVLVPSLRAVLLSSSRKIADLLACVIIVPIGALAFFWMEAGQHVWTAQFWYNMFEFSKQFTAGLASGPFYGGLQYKQFWDLIIGFLFPTVYILTIMIVGTLCVLGRVSTLNLLVIVLCVYGLGAHHYYIVMSMLNNYYMRALPFVFVVFYWVRLALGSLGREARVKAMMLLIAFCAYALWTNHHYISYPSVFNFSRNPMIDPLVRENLPDGGSYLYHKIRWVKESMKFPLNSLGEKAEGIKSEQDFDSDEALKAYYKQETDFTQDAALISGLAAANEPVALVSSCETEILMQANRRPLFYYFSLFFSRPLWMRNFGDSEIYTKKQLERMTRQLENASSPYLFMEKIFLNRDIPAQYQYDEPGLMGLLEYVNKHYRPYRDGKYLVALKRIPAGE